MFWRILAAARPQGCRGRGEIRCGQPGGLSGIQSRPCALRSVSQPGTSGRSAAGPPVLRTPLISHVSSDPVTSPILRSHICESGTPGSHRWPGVGQARPAHRERSALALPWSPLTGPCVRGGGWLSPTIGVCFLLEQMGLLPEPHVARTVGAPCSRQDAFSRGGQAGPQARTLPRLLFHLAGTSQGAAPQESIHYPNVGRKITFLSFYTSVSSYHFHCVLSGNNGTWRPVLRQIPGRQLERMCVFV